MERKQKIYLEVLHDVTFKPFFVIFSDEIQDLSLENISFFTAYRIEYN